MIALVVLCVGLVVLVVLTDIVLLLFWKSGDAVWAEPKEWPNVTVLIAARNEAENIGHALQSILGQDYPKDRLTILVGDDMSEDDTFDIANDLLKSFENGRVIQIKSELKHQKGKGNVLAQLAKYAKGDYFLITDADIQLPPTWVKGMVKRVGSKTGIVTGVTYSKVNLMQGLDWLFALGMVKVLHNMGISVTTMGNNMLITKQAYETVGGYEAIPFSVTEDLELFKHVKRAGFDVWQAYDEDVLAKTKPVNGFIHLLAQRKRWMRGALTLPLPIVLLLFIQAIYFPTMLLLLFTQFYLGLILFVIKGVLRVALLKSFTARLKIKIPMSSFMRYEFYSWIVSLGTLFYYLLPIQVKWKGRKY